MKRLQTVETVSGQLRRLVRWGTLTNLYLSPARLSRAIERGQALYEEREDSFLLLLLEDPVRCYFIARPEASLPALPPFSGDIVCEYAMKGDDFTAVDTLLRSLGLEPILRRERLSRRKDAISVPAGSDLVRVAGPEDLNTADAILTGCFDRLTGCIPSRDALAEELAAGHILLCGTEGLLHFSAEGTYSELRHLAVLPAHRGQGIASALLADYLDRIGTQTSRLWVAEHNQNARALYERFGYAEDGYVSAVYHKKEHGRMDKILEILRELVPEAEISEDSLLVEDEIIDSFDLVALVGELSDAFDVQIGVEDVTPENFETPETILALIERLRDE